MPSIQSVQQLSPAFDHSGRTQATRRERFYHVRSAPSVDVALGPCDTLRRRRRLGLGGMDKDRIGPTRKSGANPGRPAGGGTRKPSSPRIGRRARCCPRPNCAGGTAFGSSGLGRRTVGGCRTAYGRSTTPGHRRLSPLNPFDFACTGTDHVGRTSSEAESESADRSDSPRGTRPFSDGSLRTALQASPEPCHW